MSKVGIIFTLLLSLSEFLNDVRCDIPSEVQGNARTDKVAIHAFKETAMGLSMSNGIIREGRAASEQNHDVIFVVRQRNREELEHILAEISDPSRPNYGAYMSRKFFVENFLSLLNLSDSLLVRLALCSDRYFWSL